MDNLKKKILQMIFTAIKNHIKIILSFNIKNSHKRVIIFLYSLVWVIFLFFTYKYLLPLILYSIKQVIPPLDKPLAECGGCCSKTPKNSPTEGAINHSKTLVWHKKNNPKTFEYDKKNAINTSLHKGSAIVVGGIAETLSNAPSIKSPAQGLKHFASGALKATAVTEFIQNPISGAINNKYPGSEGKRPEINEYENNENN